MRILTKTLSATALALAAAGFLAAPSQAYEILYAGYNLPNNSGQDLDFVSSGPSANLFTTANSTGTSLANAPGGRISLWDPHTGLSLTDVPVVFRLSAATSDAATFDGATYTQTGVTGTFSFTYTGTTAAAAAANGGAGYGSEAVTHNEVLFSGTFTNAWIQGNTGVGGLAVTIGNHGSATFTPSAVDLFPELIPGSEEFTIHLATVTPGFGVTGINGPLCTATPTVANCANTTGNTLDSFRAHGAGDFQFAAVPEPASWGLMILGFGGIGAAVRNRRRTSIAAA